MTRQVHTPAPTQQPTEKQTSPGVEKELPKDPFAGIKSPLPSVDATTKDAYAKLLQQLPPKLPPGALDPTSMKGTPIDPALMEKLAPLTTPGSSTAMGEKLKGAYTDLGKALQQEGVKPPQEVKRVP